MQSMDELCIYDTFMKKPQVVVLNCRRQSEIEEQKFQDSKKLHIMKCDVPSVEKVFDKALGFWVLAQNGNGIIVCLHGEI